MLGPVFHLELLHSSRRGRQQLLRWLYAGWLILEFLVLYLMYLTRLVLPGQRPDPNAAGQFAGTFLDLILVQHFVLLVLVTPAFVAGTITDEKTRGTLQHMLTTNLTATEIVLGKLLGQIFRLAELALVGLPFLCFFGVFAGLTPALLLALGLGSLGLLLALASASLLASVWCRSTNDAVLSVYLVGGGAVAVLAFLGAPWEVFDPRYVLEAAWFVPDLAELIRRLCLSWLVWGSLSVCCLVLAVWRLRPAYVRQLTAVAPRKRGWGWKQRPDVSNLPIRWKERWIERPTLSLVRWVPGWAGLAAAIILPIATSVVIIWRRILVTALFRGTNESHDLFDLWLASPPSDDAFHIQGVLVAFFAGLVMAVRCSGAICGERERLTWEALLLTPLEAKQLVRGKLWGIFDAARPYLLAYTIPAVLLSLLGGFWAFFWTAFWCAAAWVLVYFMGALGIHSSVRASSSWRSLLTTLTSGGRALLASYLFFGLPLGALGGALVGVLIDLLLVYVLLGFDDLAFKATTWQIFTASCYFLGPYFMTAVALFSRAELLLEDAEKQVSLTERIRQNREGIPTPDPTDARSRKILLRILGEGEPTRR